MALIPPTKEPHPLQVIGPNQRQAATLLRVPQQPSQPRRVWPLACLATDELLACLALSGVGRCLSAKFSDWLA